MLLRVGLMSVAHLHAGSYAHCLAQLPDAEFAGVWDDDRARGEAFATRYGAPFYATAADLLAACDAVVVCSENTKHRAYAEAAFATGRSVLCEKPLATTVEDAQAMIDGAAAAGVVLMTAFPCPYVPAFERLLEKVRAGEIGRVLAVAATNRGQCPGGWFVEPALSGGGAMIDHTVHVADLLRRLTGEEPSQVEAQTGHNMHGQTWEDTAMLTIGFPSGVFATLDSSWSRPRSYKTWGDVTMKVVGEKGLIEVDLFGPGVEVYSDTKPGHWLSGTGSNADMAMVREFLSAVAEQRPPRTTGQDGLAATRVAAAAYASARSGQAVDL